MFTKRPHTGGFTIIEVMFVLAIGGLILLIIFEALPVLERNGRNNERKQDVAAILEAVSHYELNHSGDFPNQPTTMDNFLQYTNLNFYSNKTGVGLYSQIFVLQNSATDASRGNSASITSDNVLIENFSKCATDNSGKFNNIGAGYSDVIASFALESGNGVTAQCEQL